MRTIILILLFSQGVILEAVGRKRENVDSVKFQQFDNYRKGIRLRTRWKLRYESSTLILKLIILFLFSGARSLEMAHGGHQGWEGGGA